MNTTTKKKSAKKQTAATTTTVTLSNARLVFGSGKGAPLIGFDTSAKTNGDSLRAQLGVSAYFGFNPTNGWWVGYTQETADAFKAAGCPVKASKTDLAKAKAILEAEAALRAAKQARKALNPAKQDETTTKAEKPAKTANLSPVEYLKAQGFTVKQIAEMSDAKIAMLLGC